MLNRESVLTIASKVRELVDDALRRELKKQGKPPKQYDERDEEFDEELATVDRRIAEIEALYSRNAAVKARKMVAYARSRGEKMAFSDAMANVVGRPDRYAKRKRPRNRSELASQNAFVECFRAMSRGEQPNYVGAMRKQLARLT